MCHTHHLALEVSRSTIDAVVGRRNAGQTCVGLVDVRGCLLMSTVDSQVVIRQSLSEEQVVIRPDGVVLAVGGVETYVLVLGNRTSGIDVVSVGIAVFDVSEGLVAGTLAVKRVDGVGGSVVLRLGFCGQGAVAIGAPESVRLIARLAQCLVEVALVEVEAVEVVGHLAVVEGAERHLACAASVVRFYFIYIRFGIVAVHDLCSVGVRRVAEDGLYAGRALRGRVAALDPAVLHIASADIHDTCCGEVAGDAEVIDLAAEFVEERVGESADGVAVAVQGAFEAVFVGADGRPGGVGLRCDVAAEVELQVLRGSDEFGVHAVVSAEGSVIGDGHRLVLLVVLLGLQRQVEEVLQEVEFVLCGIGGAVAAVDVDLRVALTVGILVVKEHVVLLVQHHLVEVVVVGHGELYGVGVGLAQIGLGVVGHVVAVLIPEHLRVVVDVRLSVLVAGGIGQVGKEFPSGSQNLKCSGFYIRHLQTHRGAWQHGVGFGELAYLGHAALELQVDVDDMALGDGRDVHAGFVALFVFIGEHDGDHLVLAEVEDVRFAGHDERGGLHRRAAIDGEELLLLLIIYRLVG